MITIKIPKGYDINYGIMKLRGAMRAESTLDEYRLRDYYVSDSEKSHRKKIMNKFMSELARKGNKR